MSRILVVDDKATSRELIRTVLESVGHTVSEAGDGREAVRVALDILPDLVLLLLLPSQLLSKHP